MWISVIYIDIVAVYMEESYKSNHHYAFVRIFLNINIGTYVLVRDTY
jgi:hypothetical protein